MPDTTGRRGRGRLGGGFNRFFFNRLRLGLEELRRGRDEDRLRGGGRDGQNLGSRLRRLDQARRRQRGRGRFCGLGRFARGPLSLRGRGGIGEGRIRGHGQIALPRHAPHELTRDDFLDGARGALYLDAVIALEQRHHFLARSVQELRDFINPDCCHSVKVLKF
jgi:hypothetical protein